MSFDTALQIQGWRSSALTQTQNRPRRGLPKVLMTIMLLMSLATFVSAQDGATQALPTGIVNKTPPQEGDKKDEAAATAAAAAEINNATDNTVKPEEPPEELDHD